MKRAVGRGLCAAAFLGIALVAAFAAAPAAAQDSCTACLVQPIVTSTPASGSTYLPGETITVQVRPRNSPWVSITSADSPTLGLNVGGSVKSLSGTLQSRQYSYTVYDHEQRQYVTRSRDTNVLEFSYTVQKGDRDTDGVSVAANALGGGFIGANVGGSSFGGGTHRPNISKNHSAMRAQSGHKVDTPAPSWSGVTGPDIIFYAGGSVSYRLPQVANAASAHNVSYSVTSARPLPTGYTLNASTGTITGSYGSALARQSYTLRATDGFNRTADLTFHLQVSAEAGIESISITSNPGADKTYGKVAPFGTNDTIFVRVDITHRLTTVLASNVCLDIRIGSNIRRTCNPSYSTSDASRWDKLDFSYAVQAGDWDGDGISFPTNPMGAGKIGGLRFRLTGIGTDNRVNRNFASIPADANHKVRGQQTVPSFGSTASPSHSWLKGNAVSQALPAATGGDGGVTYSIEESLPAGLSFAAATRTISGTPTAAQAAANYTLAATDADGDKATLRFSLEIEEITVSIDSPNVTEGDSGSTDLTFTATLNTASTQQVTVDYADAGTGTATSGTDYTAITDGTLTFTAGTTSQTFDVSVTGDTTDEVDETILVTLSNASGATISTATGTGTITDDDDPPTVSVAAASVTEGDSGSKNLTFTATLSAASGKQVTVSWAEGTGGTATSGTDYTAITGGTLTFAAGTTSQTFNVSVTGDVVDESNETVVVTLSSPTNATISATAGSATGTITDDDATPTSITLTVNDDSVGEGDGDATITVTATVDGTTQFGTAKTVTVSVAGSGTASAVDFAAVSDFDITIAAGAASKSETFTLSPTDDSVDETDETITVSGASTGLTINQDTITLSDDDATPSITLSVDDSSVGEGDGATTITVTATVDGMTRFGTAKTVTVSVAGSGTAAAVDFAAVSNFNISIGAGEASGTETFTLTPTDDSVDETDETITVSGSSGSLTVNSATITLSDDDAAPTVTLALSRTAIDESGTANSATVTASLNHASSVQTTVIVSAAPGTNTAADDFALSSNKTLTIAAGSTSSTGTVTITAADNSADDPDKSVTVSGSASNSQGVTDPADVSLAIRDDDAAPVLSIDSPSVAEGAGGSTATLRFTVSLSTASGKQVTVNYADAGTGTATSGTDYTAITGATLTFAAGQTSKTFDVSVTGDGMDEPDETVLVALSGPANATVSTSAGTGTGTITDDDASPTVTLALSPTAIDESGTTNSATVTASLNHASSVQTTVTVSAAPGTNTAAADFALSSNKTLTIAAGATSSTGTVTITAADNSADDPDKSVTVSGSATNSQGVTGPADVSLAIRDDDAAPVLSIDSPSVTEGNSGTTNLTFTVSLSAASGKQVTVNYADAGTGTATSGTDYTAITGATLTFAAGQTSKTFDVSVTGDGTDEPDETVLVALSGPANATVSTSAGTGTGTITDDDATPTVTLALSLTAIDESGAANSATVTASLNHASSVQTTVTVSAAPGTSTAASDYSLSANKTLTIAAGSTSSTGTVTITAADNSADDPDKSVTVSGSATNSQGVTGPADVSLAIRDDDAAPVLSIDSPSVAEGAGGSTATLRFTVSLSPASGKQVTVNYADAGTGTATSGTDYTAITGATLTFAAGQTSKTFDVSVTGDGMDEPDETVLVALSNPTNATVSSTAGTGTGTITDDDAAPVLSIDSPSVTEGNSGTTNLTFTVSLSPASGQQVTVNYADAGTGTATSGTDYTAITGATLTFTAGQTSKTFDVSVTGDGTDEPDETVLVALSGPANAAVSSTAGTGTGTITDDDATPTVTLALSRTAIDESGTANSATVTASLNHASSAQTTVTVSAAPGTNTAADDFALSSNKMLTIAAGSTSSTGTVTITAADNSADDPDKSVTVSGSATNSQGVTGPADVSLAIRDDDAAPVLSIDSPSVAEGAGGSTATLRFTVSLSPASGKQVTVNYADAGTGTATSGTDYTAITGATLTFAAGQTSKTFDVSVTGDGTDEPDETVLVALSNPTNATVSSTAGTGTGTITDDDAAPVLSIDSPSVTEGNSGTTNLTFTVSLGAASGKQVTVNYADAGTGTATSGTDYTALSSGTLTFAAGQTSKTISVSVTGDGMDEPNETVLVALSNPTNATVSSTAGTGTGTITDDDASPAVTLALSRGTIDESGAENSATVTATLNHASSAQTTVIVSAAPGTNTVAGDYSLSANKTLAIAAGSTSSTGTVTITAVNNAAVNPDKSVTVSGRASNSLGVTDPADVSLAIRDDDAILSIDSPSVAEGAGGSTATLRFTVSLSEASGQQVTVNYADAGAGTATSGTDYVALPSGTLTFAPGETSKTISVAVTGDDLDEPDETVLVSLSGPSNAAVSASAGAGTGTITDDDPPPVISIDSPEVAEGEDGTTATLRFTVSLSAASGRPVTVDYADAGTGTATQGTDYEELADGTLSFAPGDRTRTIDVTVIGDGVYEANKTVVLSLSSPTNATVPVETGTGAIADDDPPPAVRLVLTPATIDESGAANSATVTATLSYPSSARTTVTVAAAPDNDAVAGSFSPSSNRTLTIPAGGTSSTGEVTITATDNSRDEPDKKVTVSGTAANAQGVTDPPAVTLTILDDDDAPALSIDSPSIAEGRDGTTATLRFTVSLSAASGKRVTVDYADAGTGTATSGTDYETLAGGTLAFAPGDTVETIDVTVIGDGMYEADETVMVSLGSPANATVADGGTGTGTITADDDPPLAPPSFTEPAYAFDLAENQAGPLVLGSVTATDPDGDGQLSYALAEGDGARFEVDASGGMVRYVGPGEDAETTPEAYDLVVRATDGDGLSAEAAVVVTVLDVNEGPEVAETIAPKSLEAFGAAAEDDLNSHFTDPDGDALSYAAASSAPGVALAAVSESGRLSIAPQATGVATVTVTATDPGGLETQQQVRVTVERSRAERSRALKLALAAFGRSLGTETVDAIGGRLAAGEPGRALGRSHVQVGGRSVGCGGWAGDGACDLESVAHSATGLLGLRLSLPTSGLSPGGGLAGDPAGGSVAQTDIATLLFGENSDRMGIGFGFGGNSGFGGRNHGFGSGSYAGGQGTADSGNYAGGESDARRGNGDAGNDGGGNYAGGGDGTDGGGSNDGGSSAGRRDRGGLTSNPVSSQSLLSESSFQLFFGNGSDEGDSRENGMGGNDSGNGAAASQLRNSSSSGWTLWGQANAGGFEGHPGDGFNLKGRTRSAYLGLDYRFSSGLLLGLAGSRSSFDSDYESATNGSGSVDANMTSLYPYFQWSPTEELGLWGLAGAGRGSANLSELAEDPFRHKLTMGMAALGARQELVGPLALKADAFAVRIWSDDSEEVPGVTANAHRVRLAPELRGNLSVGEALSVRTRLELGGRFDGGDAETGGGAEAGAEVGLAHEPTGITVEARGRMLLAHQAEEFKDWGASVTVRVQPGRNREGLSLSLEPSWGDASSGAQTLWQGDYAALGSRSLFHASQAAGGGPGWMPARMAMELGWGLALSGGAKITPFGRWRREGMNGHRFEVGTRLAVLGGRSSDTDGDSSARGLRVAVDLFGEHVSRGGLRPPERRIGIQGRILFKE